MNNTMPLTSNKCHQLTTVQRSCVCITLDGRIVDSMRWRQILAEMRFSYPTCIRCPHQNIAIRFGTEKLEWSGYLMVKKLKICLFISTEYMNMMDRWTDRWTGTAWQHRLHLRIASRSKSRKKLRYKILGYIILQVYISYTVIQRTKFR